MTYGMMIFAQVGILAFAVAQATDPLSGGAGWIGAGLLGAVLCAVFFVLLPAKDKQMEKKDEQINKLIDGKDEHIKQLVEDNNKDRDNLMARYDAERKSEAQSRHERANAFQATLLQMLIEHRATIKSIEDQHHADAERDRAAFLGRNDMLMAAIREQTKEINNAFAAALKENCHWARQQSECSDKE